MNLAYDLASLPLVPRTLVRLIYGSKYILRKYWDKGTVLERHCRQLFIKHVFPMFLSPTRPFLLLLAIVMLTGLLSSSISAHSHVLK